MITKELTAILEPLDSFGSRAVACRSAGKYRCPKCHDTEDLLSMAIKGSNSILIWCSCGAVSLNGILLDKRE